MLPSIQAMRNATFLLVLLIALIGCREDEVLPSVPGPPWMGHIELSVDSACVQAGNVITPNGDGINDELRVFTNNVSAVQITIFRMNGSTVFNSNALWPRWPDAASVDLGRYRLLVSATSLSGVQLTGWSFLDVMDYGANTCLPYDGLPVCGDQLDPRICGVPYPTNEIFCP